MDSWGFNVSKGVSLSAVLKTKTSKSGGHQLSPFALLFLDHIFFSPFEPFSPPSRSFFFFFLPLLEGWWDEVEVERRFDTILDDFNYTARR